MAKYKRPTLAQIKSHNCDQCAGFGYRPDFSDYTHYDDVPAKEAQECGHKRPCRSHQCYELMEHNRI